jgi:hypothetical protein
MRSLPATEARTHEFVRQRDDGIDIHAAKFPHPLGFIDQFTDTDGAADRASRKRVPVSPSGSSMRRGADSRALVMSDMTFVLPSPSDKRLKLSDCVPKVQV